MKISTKLKLLTCLLGIYRKTKIYMIVYKGRLCFKIQAVLPNKDGKHKGNIDADLVLQAVVDCCEGRFDKAVIITSDGDFYSLVNFLYQRENWEW